MGLEGWQKEGHGPLSFVATKGAAKAQFFDGFDKRPMLHRRACRVSNRLDFAGAPERFVMSRKIGIPLEFQWFAP
jgi:hypothetical protein